jgi:putative endonuclease
MQDAGKAFVYVLQTEAEPGHSYVGVTSDIEDRLLSHNTAKSGHTRRFRPWRLCVAIQFRSRVGADRFERYVKSGSGRAFAKRHFASE